MTWTLIPDNLINQGKYASSGMTSLWRHLISLIYFRNEHWNQPNSFNSGYGQSNHSNLFSDFGLRGGQPTHSHGPRAPPTQTLGDLRNSQDMLRRLLPNVNVSFNNESSMDNFGRNSYSQGKSGQSSAAAHAQSAAAHVAHAQQQAAAQLQAAQMQGPRSPAAQQRPTKAQINSLLAKQQQGLVTPGDKKIIGDTRWHI